MIMLTEISIVNSYIIWRILAEEHPTLVKKLTHSEFRKLLVKDMLHYASRKVGRLATRRAHQVVSKKRKRTSKYDVLPDSRFDSSEVHLPIVSMEDVSDMAKPVPLPEVPTSCDYMLPPKKQGKQPLTKRAQFVCDYCRYLRVKEAKRRECNVSEVARPTGRPMVVCSNSKCRARLCCGGQRQCFYHYHTVKE